MGVDRFYSVFSYLFVVLDFGIIWQANVVQVNLMEDGPTVTNKKAKTALLPQINSNSCLFVFLSVSVFNPQNFKTWIFLMNFFKKYRDQKWQYGFLWDCCEGGGCSAFQSLKKNKRTLPPEAKINKFWLRVREKMISLHFWVK